MAKLNVDQIAHIAEVISDLHFSRVVGSPFARVLFRTAHLGDKYPTVDYLVDVLDAGNLSSGFFFIQVKGTASASPTSPRLAIDVSLERFNQLVRLSAPAYLVAVDIVSEEAYLVAACRSRKGAVASITKAFPLSDAAVKIALYREVAEFWASHKPLRRQSRFQDG
jgi:hypothetical protein